MEEHIECKNKRGRNVWNWFAGKYVIDTERIALCIKTHWVKSKNQIM